MAENSNDNLLIDFYNATRDSLSARLGSPLIGSFVISWIILNYKIIMVMLTEQSEAFVFDYKISLIDNYYNIYSGLIYPFVISLFYTFVYPFIDERITVFTLNRKKAIREKRIVIEQTQTKTEEQVKLVLVRHYHEVVDLKNQIENADSTITKLRAVVSSQVESLERLNLEITEANHKLNRLDAKTTKASPIISDTLEVKVPRKINVNVRKNEVASTEEALMAVVNTLNKQSLLMFKKIAEHEELIGKGINTENIAMMSDSPSIFKLKEAKLIDITTDVKSFDKLYVLTSKGKAVYKFIEGLNKTN